MRLSTPWHRVARSFAVRLVALLLVVPLAMPAPVAAQEGAGGPPAADTADGGGEGAGLVEEAPLAPLLRVLRDDAARATLVEALEAAVGEATGEASSQTGEDAAPAEEDDPAARSLGRHVAEATRDAALGFVETLRSVETGLRATQRRLARITSIDRDELARLAEEVGLTVLATLVALFLVRAGLRPLWHLLGGVASAAGPGRMVLAFAGSVVVDALAVALAWAIGYAIATFAVGALGELRLAQVLFLNAFLLVGFVQVVLRAVLAPGEGHLRPLPLTDRTARRLTLWTGIVAGLIGYGQMMAVPLVNGLASPFVGRSLGVAVDALALVIAMGLTLSYRRAPARYLRAAAVRHDGDLTLRALAALAPLAWLVVLGWLIALFVIAVTNRGDLVGLLADTGRVLAVIAAGAGVMSLLSRTARRGVRLPEGVTGSMPMLERRLNAFVPLFLKIVRAVVLVAVISFATEVTGLFDLAGWLDGVLGGDAAGRAISVAMILLVAFALWLALVSWIDWRLTPSDARAVTSRAQTLLTLLRNAGTIAVCLITLMFALSEIGIDIAPLIASAGVLGLAIGFGAQKLVQDIITGIFIQFENAINVGEVVTVGGTTGVVEKLTIRSVSLRDLEGVFHVIPFSSVDMVSNHMRGFAYHVADLGIAYREDTDDGRRIMEECFEAMRADPAWRAKIVGPMEWFGVQSLGDSAVVLRARLRTSPGDQWAVGRRYNELLKKACDREGIEIPFPHVTLWMGEGKDGAAPPLNLRGAGGGTQPRTAAGEAKSGATPAPSDGHAHVGTRAPTTDMPDDRG